LKVLHVIPSLSASSGGPSFALPLLERALIAAGVEVTVATTDDDGPGKHAAVPLGKEVMNNGTRRFYFRKQMEFYKTSFPLSRWLREHVREFDVVHVHALFSFASVAAARCARKCGVPYIIRPLGVLNRYGMTRRRAVLKRLSCALVEGPLLRGAAAMHYTSAQEQTEAEEVGATAPAAVLPLPLDLDEFERLPGPELFLEQFPKARGRPIVLFLSRIDPKKGLDLLLPSFAEARRAHPGAILVVAGGGDDGYLDQLHRQADGLGLAGEVVWTGFLAGATKLSAMRAATLFVLPSYSENFGIALAEAMAAGLPCITTHEVGISDRILSRDAGLVVKPQVRELEAALERLLAEPSLRARLAANSRRLVSELYSLSATGQGMLALYKTVLKRPLVRA
jgi:glycosyltransferase involved in cell wall biosynthesis